MRNGRKWLALTLAFCMLLSLPVAAVAAKETQTLTYCGINMTVDGVKIIPTTVNGAVVEPFMIDDTTYLPVRALSESLGFDVEWVDSTHTIRITSGGTGGTAESANEVPEEATGKVGSVEVSLTYCDITIEVDGEVITPTDATGAAVEPFVIDGTTYLPIRALSEALGYTVVWNNSTLTVEISSEETSSSDTLMAGAGMAEMVFPQEYFEIIEEDGTVSYEDGFNGQVYTFDSDYGEIVDNLCTRVLVLEDEIRVAIVAVEVAQTPDDQVAYTKEIVSEICGVDEANVWIHCTHQFGFMHRPSDTEKAAVYDDIMKEAVAVACEQAMETFQPAVMGTGTGDCYVSANKNIENPEGVTGGPYYGPGSTLETNTTLTMIRFASAETGEDIGYFMSYGTKPSALCTTGKTVGNRQVNTEVTGEACKLVEAAYDVPCLFCMPAAGDQYPRETAQYYGFDEEGNWGLIDIGFDEGIKIVEKLGAEMGGVAIDVASTIECAADDADISIAATSYDYANKAGDADVTITCDALVIGDIALVGFKQEMDCATEQQIQEASPYSTTLMVSFLNGDGKYFGHREAYDFNGGVGTWETNRSAYGIGAAEKFVEVAADLLTDMYNGVDTSNDGGGSSTGTPFSYFSTLEFGGYTWYVLDKKDGLTLVLSKDIIEMGTYNDTTEAATWETCTLRTYLNGEFYERFSAEDREKIVEVTNANRSNTRYGISGGNDTEDKVFLLSLDEAGVYLDGFADVLIGKTTDGTSTWWFLRSPGEAANVAACVTANGAIDYHGISDTLTAPVGGIRPAMWLDLG